MPLAPYDLLHRVVVEAGQLKVELHTVRRPDGQEVTLPRIDLPDFICVVALTSEGQAVLVRQWRQQLGRFTLEVVGGTVDPDETPREAAFRELCAETGYQSATLTPVGRIQSAIGGVDASGYVYLAEDCSQLAHWHIDEPTEVALLDASEAFAAAGREVEISESALALLLAERHLLERQR